MESASPDRCRGRDANARPRDRQAFLGSGRVNDTRYSNRFRGYSGGNTQELMPKIWAGIPRIANPAPEFGRLTKRRPTNAARQRTVCPARSPPGGAVFGEHLRQRLRARSSGRLVFGLSITFLLLSAAIAANIGGQTPEMRGACIAQAQVSVPEWRAPARPLANDY